jgi:hypothetical protein
MSMLSIKERRYTRVISFIHSCIARHWWQSLNFKKHGVCVLCPVNSGVVVQAQARAMADGALELSKVLKQLCDGAHELRCVAWDDLPPDRLKHSGCPLANGFDPELYLLEYFALLDNTDR